MISRRRTLWTGCALGLVSVALGIGIGELLAALLRPEASPTIAVGNRFIIATPEWLKRLAIEWFGTNDKHALLTGIYVVIALFGAAVGMLAMYRRGAASLAIAAFTVIGAYSSWTTNAPRFSDALPSVVAGAVCAFTLSLLVERFATMQTAAVEAETVLDRAKPGSDAAKAAFATAGMQRRRFLVVTGLSAGAAALSGVAGRAFQHTRYDVSAARDAVVLPTPADSASALPPGVDLGKSGIPFGIPNREFYRIDTALVVPQLDPATWKLKIHGDVTTPMTITYAQLTARPMVQRWITMACVSNDVGGSLVGTALFQGVLLADILKEAGVKAGADQLVSHSSDGMSIGTPTAVAMDGRDAMLAVAMNGEPLPVEHGFPVRMVVPGLYGYVSACKWIVEIEATTFSEYDPYWVARGWAQQGPVLLASRIDSPREGSSKKVGETIAIAGTAWQTHVGISKVEVKVDDEDWAAATLAAVPSIDTWVQWVLPWTVAAAGAHTVTVRATNTRGEVQTAKVADPFPSGATGLHSISFTGVKG